MGAAATDHRNKNTAILADVPQNDGKILRVCRGRRYGVYATIAAVSDDLAESNRDFVEISAENAAAKIWETKRPIGNSTGTKSRRTWFKLGLKGKRGY